MILEIVSVGTELLMGQVTNTNAKFIAEHVSPYGYACLYQVTVGDNTQRLTEVARTALSRADVVIFTGGLGPTADDITKETVAAVMGKTVVPNEREIAHLKEIFAARGYGCTMNNFKQAWFPEDATVLPNPRGTAPGCIIEQQGKAAILLPGPPREMEPMFIESVLPYLAQRTDAYLYSKELRFFGIGESQLCDILNDLIENQTNPTLASYVKTGECTLRLTAKCGSEEEGEAMLAPLLSVIRERVGDKLYSENGEPLNALCARLLTENGKSIAFAESCTGGLLTGSLVDIPGSSSFLMEGDVTYSNDAKMRRLGVLPETLDRFGAVSAECAAEMAEGIRRTAHTEIGMATTGIAGPGGGTPEKPVGLVYVGYSDANGTETVMLKLSGDRARIREVAVLNALDILRRKLLN